MVVRSSTVTTKPPVEDISLTPNRDDDDNDRDRDENTPDANRRSESSSSSATNEDEDREGRDPNLPTEDSGDDGPEQDPGSSSASDLTVLPNAPYSEEEVVDLATSLQRGGPFFMGNDVRSAESAVKVAKALLDVLEDIGYEKPKVKGDVMSERKKVAEETKEAFSNSAISRITASHSPYETASSLYRSDKPDSEVPTSGNISGTPSDRSTFESPEKPGEDVEREPPVRRGDEPPTTSPSPTESGTLPTRRPEQHSAPSTGSQPKESTTGPSYPPDDEDENEGTSRSTETSGRRTTGREQDK